MVANDRYNTFYLTNIFKDISHEELRKGFLPQRFLLDAFLLKKMNELGNRFGFFHYRNVRDSGKLIQSLNKI